MVSLKKLRGKYKGIFGDISDIDVILTETLKIDRSKLFLDIIVTAQQEKEIEAKINRLKSGEPVSYITGHREFMSLDFSVNPSTLIPRQDTEILVEEVIKHFNGQNPFIFEIGTGSGCIAISLAKYINGAKVVACDISEEAIETAKQNAEKNGVAHRIEFIKQDIMSSFPDFGKAPDCIVSNPPYIETDVVKTLDNSVKDYEPLSALDGGADGLDFYRQIVNLNNLKVGGLLAFEIGYNQGETVEKIMTHSFKSINIIKDLGGNDRVVLGVKK